MVNLFPLLFICLCAVLGWIVAGLLGLACGLAIGLAVVLLANVPGRW